MFIFIFQNTRNKLGGFRVTIYGNETPQALS